MARCNNHGDSTPPHAQGPRLYVGELGRGCRLTDSCRQACRHPIMLQAEDMVAPYASPHALPSPPAVYPPNPGPRRRGWPLHPCCSHPRAPVAGESVGCTVPLRLGVPRRSSPRGTAPPPRGRGGNRHCHALGAAASTRRRPLRKGWRGRGTSPPRLPLPSSDGEGAPTRPHHQSRLFTGGTPRLARATRGAAD